MSGPKMKLPLLAGVLALTAGCTSASASGSGAASSDVEALRAALDDEYRAEATYAAVIAAFGDARPFINIIEAERRHAARVKAEMDRLGIGYDPANPYLGTLAAPASLLAACEQGVAAEVENIALYDRLLPAILDPQVRDTLVALQAASRDRHLPAFERCAARGGAMGRGRGRGQGRQGSN